MQDTDEHPPSREHAPTRRHLLGAVGGAAAAGLAGCLGALGGGSGGDRLTLRSLSVEGSPGGQVTVNPPNTVALVDFFATWCAPCRPQMAELRTVHERFPDVHLVSITNESDEAAVEQFWREYDGAWPVALDPEQKATVAYEARQVPTKVIVDAEGEEVWRHVGLSAAETIAGELREAGATAR